MPPRSPKPSKADPRPPPPSEAPLPPLGLRLREFALAELASAHHHLGREGASRHDGVHQARKAIRRARAALALGRKPLGRDARRLDTQLAVLCRGLSPLRDAQALIEGLQRLASTASAPLQTALPELLSLAGERRAERLARALAADPGLERRRARLQAMSQRLAALDWPAVKRGKAAAALSRSEARVARSRKRIHREPGNDEHWHALRRRLRRLRQQDHLLAQIEPSLRPNVAVTLEEATILGEAQDDALLLRHCGTRSPFPPDLRKLLRKEARARLRRVRSPPARE
jgi:CHAD domain-containing protein